MKKPILMVFILLFYSTISDAQQPYTPSGGRMTVRRQLFPNELNTFRRTPYEIMKPTLFKKIRTAAEEMLKPENNSRKWRAQSIREWACICAGIEALMPGSGPIDTLRVVP